MAPGKNIILVSYVSGTFGSSLVNLLSGAAECHGEFKMFNSNVNHWHRQKWTFDPVKYNGGFITDDTVLEIPDIVENTSKYVVGQFHNMNINTLRKYFSNAKIIMLSINPEQFNFALHRWWKVIGLDQKQIHNNRIEQISAAYDVITYNANYYFDTKIITENTSNVLTVKFDDTINRIADIEKFLEISFIDNQVNAYKEFIQKQLNTFYKVDDNFMFAWQAVDALGQEAPIIDLANEFPSTQELKQYLNEQK